MRIEEMYLSKLFALRFKSYSEMEWEFSPGVNFILGDNGTGKTNVLDAIHYLLFCKSYFNAIDSQCIMSDGDQFMISGVFQKGGEEDHISCSVKKGQKKVFRRNKKDYDKLSDHIGLFPGVMVSPYDVDLVDGGSEVRRKFIDGLISQYSHEYLERLITYNKALQQRNALLKSSGRHREMIHSSIEPWNMMLTEHAGFIFETRLAFFAEFIPVFEKVYAELSNGREIPALVYESELRHQSMEDLLRHSFSKDVQLERTTSGIHKDDLEMMVHGHSLKKFGSQGQQKTYVLALKLAQYEFLYLKLGVKPILMLDDLFDRIDGKRVQAIMDKVSQGNYGQVFITDTSVERVPSMVDSSLVEVRIFDTNQPAVKSESSI
jgi:DNA replication and repair protein RecF